MKNLLLREVKKKEYAEIHLQYAPGIHDTPGTFAGKISQLLSRYDAKVIRATIFGNLHAKDDTIKQLGYHMPADFPLSWIEGANCNGSFINGIYLFAISGVEVSRFSKNNVPVGSAFRTREAEFCYLGGLYSNPSLPPGQQTEEILDLSEELLNGAGMKFENTVRTWYYLDNILDWYGTFNKVRTAFFHSRGIFNKLVPASTGIEGKNPDSSNICFELNAIKPKTKSFSIEKVISPLQCSAEEYGSSFSRAISYSDTEYSHMTVSGTASISPDGKIINIDDLPEQIELTFKVVGEILKSRGFSWKDAVRAYAYFKDKSDCDELTRYLEKHQMTDAISFICSENKVCWKDLLFEIEVDLVRKTTR